MSNRKLPTSMTPEQLFDASAAWLARACGRPDEAARLKYAPYLPLTRASSVGSNIGGGFTVPTTIVNGILAFRDQNVCRQNATVYAMGSDSTTVPVRAAGVTANFVAENTAMPETSPVFSSLTLNAKKLAVFGRYSTELDEDTSQDIGAYLIADSGAAFGAKEDDCVINSDGTSTFNGMRGLVPSLTDGTHTASVVNCASGHSMALTVDALDIAAMIGALPERFFPNCKIYCSGYFAANCLMRLGAATGGTIKTMGGPRPGMSYGGIPIIQTPKMPGSGSQAGKVVALFGDMESCVVIGSRREMTLTTSNSKYLDLDQVAFRLTQRFDTIAHNLGDGSAAGAMVALVATA